MEKKYSEILFLAYVEKNEKDFLEFFDKFLFFLKNKNKEKIVPKTISLFEKKIENFEKNKKTKIVFGKKEDKEKALLKISNFKENFDPQNIVFEENKNLISGFVLKNKFYKYNSSAKDKIFELYKNLVN